ncbi:hypothetical protein CAP35_13720 [Chitinophagaceae bacterium IBVUCB1]|nr:hypothetical protein CAP35_13720 [Chitinophagaceae bacterium IBVUCB1]
METTLSFFSSLIADLSKHIDWIVVVLVLCGGEFAKRYMSALTHIHLFAKDIKISLTWKTLIVGSVLSSVYICMLAYNHQLHREDHIKYFLSYAVATSFYEMFLKSILSKLGLKKEEE